MAQTRPASDLRLTRRRDRREFLLLSFRFSATASLVTLTACTLSDPRIDAPPQSVEPDPTPTPAPTFTGAEAGAANEHRLAAIAGSIVARHRQVLSAEQRLLFDGIRDAHVQHQDTLRSDRPTDRPTPPPPPANPPPALNPVRDLSLPNSVALLIAQERALATRHQQAALRSTGLSALLWGSMAVAAESFAAGAADPRPFIAPRPRRPAVLLSDVEAIQEMVRQLHAAVYGYQLAIGKLPAASKRRARAVTSLREHRILRDRLISGLNQRSAAVPVPEVAYVPSPNPTDPDTASTLIQRLETAQQPFCGLWLAAATTADDRALALSMLRSTSRTALAWGASLGIWPGWPD